MKQVILLVGLVTGATLSLTSPALAWEMEQRQEMNSSSHSKVECNGAGCTGTSEANGSSSGWQKQSITNANAHVSNKPLTYERGSKKHWRSPKNKNWRETTDGQIKIYWSHRDGECYVRYTEVNEQSYKYNAQSACNNGGMTIGSLVKGKNYRIQISTDKNNWSKPVVIKAR